jgi:hypothetical protein
LHSGGSKPLKSKIDCSTIVNPQAVERLGHARLTIVEQGLLIFEVVHSHAAPLDNPPQRR